MVYEFISLIFLDFGIPHPRPKEMLAQLALKSPAIAQQLVMFYKAPDFKAQYETARQLLDTAGVQLVFFEWDSGPA